MRKITPIKIDDKIRIYYDEYDDNSKSKSKEIAKTATGMTFRKRTLYSTDDDGDGVFDLSLEDAKRLAQDILNELV